MSSALLLLKQIIMMFILMGLGIILYRRHVISDQGAKELGTLLLYVVVPAVVIKNFCIERTAEKVTQLGQSLLLAVIALTAAVVLAYVLLKGKNGVSIFSGAFCNAAFIGIPLITGTVGAQAVFFISMFIVLVNFLQWTVGVFMLTNDKETMSLKKIIGNPVVIAVAIGAVIFFAGIPMPEVFMNCLTTVTNMNTPLAMIVSGIYLAQADIPSMLANKENYLVSLVRLIIIPAVTVLLFKLVPIGTTEMRLAILIAAAAPVGSNVAVFARQYQKDAALAIGQVCMSTVLCLITLPLIVLAASALF